MLRDRRKRAALCDINTGEPGASTARSLTRVCERYSQKELAVWGGSLDTALTAASLP